jgi:hypothetical protein
MSCRAYLDPLTEVALGGEPEAGLRAHLAGCDACRRELDRLRSLAGAIDRGVAGLVAGQPSEAFAARVKERLAGRRGPVAIPWRRWAPAMAGGLALAGLALWLAVGQKAGAPPPVAPRGRLSPERPQAAPVPAPPAGAPPGGTAVAAGPPAPPAPPVPARARPAPPEVLVTGDEWTQVVRLYTLSRQGRADAGRLAAPDPAPLEERLQPLAVPALMTRPLEMAPLASPWRG